MYDSRVISKMVKGDLHSKRKVSKPSSEGYLTLAGPCSYVQSSMLFYSVHMNEVCKVSTYNPR